MNRRTAIATLAAVATVPLVGVTSLAVPLYSLTMDCFGKQCETIDALWRKHRAGDFCMRKHTTRYRSIKVERSYPQVTINDRIFILIGPTPQTKTWCEVLAGKEWYVCVPIS